MTVLTAASPALKPTLSLDAGVGVGLGADTERKLGQLSRRDLVIDVIVVVVIVLAQVARLLGDRELRRRQTRRAVTSRVSGRQNTRRGRTGLIKCVIIQWYFFMICFINLAIYYV